MTRKKETTAEFMARLENDPEFQERKRKKEEEMAKRMARMTEEEEPLLAELREFGWDLESAWDLVMVSENYPEIIDVLLKHLQLPYSDKIKEGIARSLAVPEDKVRKAWPILVTEYLKAPSGWGIQLKGDKKELQLGAKDGLACALAVAVTDETLDEFIELVKDRTNGDSRILMLRALKKRRKKHPHIEQLIEELAYDPDLTKAINSWKKRGKS